MPVVPTAEDPQPAAATPERPATRAARRVAREPRSLDRDHVARAKAAGATDGDVQLTILIAAAFCMYNRMVDGLRARTPANVAAYEARAREIADYGYADPRTASIPRTE